MPTGKGEDQAEVLEKMVFNPEVPSPLEDLNEGYIFLEARELLESDFAAFNRGGKKDETPSVDTVDFDEVFYSGSIIIGELRKALVTYPTVQQNVKKGARRGTAKGRGALKHEQLDQGGEFMGFLVESVEEDRIVFAKNGERVEKFLHDQNKARVVVKGSARKPATRPAARKAEVRAPSGAIRTSPTPPPGVSRRTVPAQPEVVTERSKPEPPKDLPQRRSQRLLRSMMPDMGTSASVN
jgi:hypothetical protein